MVKAAIGEGKIEIPYSKGSLTFSEKYYGPANMWCLKDRIRKDDLIEPTSKEVAIFAESLFGGEREVEKNVTGIMTYRSLQAFTGILYDPETRLAYFLDYPKLERRGFVDMADLISRVKNGESYSQVPFESIKRMTVGWEKAENHPYITGWAHGEEGAETLSKLASRHEKGIFLAVPDTQEIVDLGEPEGRITSLSWGCGGDTGDGVVIRGNALGHHQINFAFGRFF